MENQEATGAVGNNVPNPAPGHVPRAGIDPVFGFDRRFERQIDLPGIWKRCDMRLALANREVATIFRILQRYGIPQREIAAVTEQSQSEVSEIIAGRRVVSYDVLARIALGLRIPPGMMGLAYDERTRTFLRNPSPHRSDET
jgi:hypothetical protein